MNARGAAKELLRVNELPKPVPRSGEVASFEDGASLGVPGMTAHGLPRLVPKSRHLNSKPARTGLWNTQRSRSCAVKSADAQQSGYGYQESFAGNRGKTVQCIHEIRG